jgi:predicted solute-binding protein
VRSAELIAADFGPGLGWPVALAKRYLTSRLKFTLGPRQRKGLERFLELAKRHGIVPADRSLVFA